MVQVVDNKLISGSYDGSLMVWNLAELFIEGADKKRGVTAHHSAGDEGGSDGENDVDELNEEDENEAYERKKDEEDELDRVDELRKAAAAARQH